MCTHAGTHLHTHVYTHWEHTHIVYLRTRHVHIQKQVHIHIRVHIHDIRICVCMQHKHTRTLHILTQHKQTHAYTTPTSCHTHITCVSHTHLDIQGWYQISHNHDCLLPFPLTHDYHRTALTRRPLHFTMSEMPRKTSAWRQHHNTHLNVYESFRHVPIRHVPHVNESHQPTPWYTPECEYESCPTHECVVSHTWMSHVTYMNASCHRHDTHLIVNKSCPTHEWVMSCIWMSHANTKTPTLMCMRHVPNMNVASQMTQTLTRTATHYNTLQHAAARCNTDRLSSAAGSCAQHRAVLCNLLLPRHGKLFRLCSECGLG